MRSQHSFSTRASVWVNDMTRELNMPHHPPQFEASLDQIVRGLTHRKTSQSTPQQQKGALPPTPSPTRLNQSPT